MPTETLVPNVLEALSNLTGAVADVDNTIALKDGDTGGGNSGWLFEGDDGTDTIARVKFPTPTGDPTVGSGLQTFRIWCRRSTTAGGSNPTLDVALYENTVLISTLQTGLIITSLTGQLIEVTWDATLLGAPSGSLVELHVIGQRSGGSPGDRRTVEFDEFEWLADYTAAVYPINFVSAGAVSASVAQHAIAPGSGRQADDIDWLIVETANEVPTLNVANGFVLAAASTGQGTSGGLTATRLHLYWRRWNGSDGSPEISVGIDHSLARIVSYRGVRATGLPWDESIHIRQLTTAGTVGSIQGWNPPNIPDQLIAAFTSADLPDSTGTSEFSAWVNSSLDDVTERTDDTSSVGNGGAISCTDGQLPTFLSLAATAFTSATSSLKEYLMVAMAPAGPVEMAANGAGTSSGVATMGRLRGLVSNGAGCVATGVAVIGIALGMLALGTCGSAGVATMGRDRGLVAVGAGTSAGTAVMGRDRGMIAIGAATSGGVADMAASVSMIANGAAFSSGVADMYLSIGMVAQGAGTSSGAAVISRLRGMVATGGGSATGVASMTAPPAVDFVAKVRRLHWRRDVFRWHTRTSWSPRYILPTAGASPVDMTSNGAGTSAGVAAMGRVRELTAISGGTSSGVATMGAVVPMTATGGGTATGVATMGRLRGIVATGGGVATGLATMGRDLGLVSNGAGTATGLATMSLLTEPVFDFVTKARHLRWRRDVFRWHARPSTRSKYITAGAGVASMASHGSATSAGTAIMGRARGLVSNGTTSDSGVATMQRLRGLVANDGGTSAGVADLTIDVGMTANGAASSTGVADMGRLRGLVAAGAGTSDGVAALTIESPPGGTTIVYLKKRRLQYRRDVFRWKVRAITRVVVAAEPLITDYISNGTATSSGVADMTIRHAPVLKLRRAARWARLRPIDYRRYGRVPTVIQYLGGGASDMTSHGTAAASGTAILQRVRGLVANGSAVAGGVATMGRLRAMVVNGAGTSSGLADLTIAAAIVSMTANGAATSSGVADMGRLRGLVANGAATSAGAATMGVDLGMVAVGAGTSSGIATMGLTVGMVAIGGGAATGLADMTVATGMIANGVATSSGVATMGLQVSMTSHGGGTSSGFADLQGTNVVGMISHGQAYSFGFARMTGVGRPGLAWWAHRKQRGRPLG